MSRFSQLMCAVHYVIFCIQILLYVTADLNSETAGLVGHSCYMQESGIACSLSSCICICWFGLVPVGMTLGFWVSDMDAILRLNQKW